MTASPDLSGPIYAALTGASDLLDGVAIYSGAPAVFTERPVPDDCGYPLVIAAGDITHGDQDFIDDPLRVLTRDIGIYGKNTKDYRAVEAIALRIRDRFHRNRESLIVPGWNVVDVRCQGPIVAPTDDDHSCGRIVILTVRLSAV